MIRTVELIQRKRDGEPLSDEAIAALVEGFVAGAVPDYQMAAFLMAVYFRGLTAQETAALTLAMARSGETLDLGPLAARAVDKHSSGGVGDKTSLVVVPLAAACGVLVPKLSGRGLGHTGGTLDKLEAIPGVRTALTREELVAQVERIGCAIAGQSERLVPADAKMYALRDVTATVDSLPLIASSIMSKKLAVTTSAVLLDVKCGGGAFMRTEADARALAETMVAIGRRAGRCTVAVITGMDEPLGRAVGNALEVEEAVATLRGEGPADFAALCLTLTGWMVALGGLAASADEGRALAERRLRAGDGLDRLRRLIEAQGGDPRVADDPGRLPQAVVRWPVPAPASGVVAQVDAREIGLAAMRLGAGRARKGDAIDPAVGVVLRRRVGERVEPGETLAVIHARSGASAEAAAREVAAAYVIGPAGAPAPLVRGVVR